MLLSSIHGKAVVIPNCMTVAEYLVKGWPDELKQELKQKLVMNYPEVICNRTVGLELGDLFCTSSNEYCSFRSMRRHKTDQELACCCS